MKNFPNDSSDFFTDSYYMGMALAEARKAADEDEVPIGAVIVTADGRIVGKGHNRTEALRDVTAHAEMMALSAASAALGGKFLSNCTLYVTVEPCPMCAGAIGWARVGRVVIGTEDARRGFSTILREGASPFHPRTEVVWGVCHDLCAEVIRDFFHQKR